MDITQFKDLLGQVQTGAHVTTAIGEAIPVGNRVVIPVVEIAYGGGGGGGGGKSTRNEQMEGAGGGGGVGVRVRPLGCWVIGPDDERWLPALDINHVILLAGSISMLLLVTIRALIRRRR